MTKAIGGLYSKQAFLALRLLVDRGTLSFGLRLAWRSRTLEGCRRSWAVTAEVQRVTWHRDSRAHQNLPPQWQVQPTQT